MISNIKKITILYALITIGVVLLSWFMDFSENNITYLLLLSLVIFFGFPHGALDSLLAKKNKVFSKFKGFILFNLIYLMIAIITFFIWLEIPFLSLVFFLMISAFHFSEDWKEKINIFQRLILGISIISLPVFFNSNEAVLIYTKMINNMDAIRLVKYQSHIMYFLFPIFFLVMIKNIKNKIFLSQNIIIISSSILLSPIFYFICYFCFFHSIKNFQETIYEIKERENNIILFVFINCFLSIIIGSFLFFYFLDGDKDSKLITITFAGLASLTLPHMALRAYLNYKERLFFQKTWH